MKNWLRKKIKNWLGYYDAQDVHKIADHSVAKSFQKINDLLSEISDITESTIGEKVIDLEQKLQILLDLHSPNKYVTSETFKDCVDLITEDVLSLQKDQAQLFNLLNLAVESDDDINSASYAVFVIRSQQVGTSDFIRVFDLSKRNEQAIDTLTFLQQITSKAKDE